MLVRIHVYSPFSFILEHREFGNLRSESLKVNPKLEIELALRPNISCWGKGLNHSLSSWLSCHTPYPYTLLPKSDFISQARMQKFVKHRIFRKTKVH